MAEGAGAAPAVIPRTRSLARLRAAAAECQACDLYRDATQTVFGAGPRDAPLMLVGETPGDVEDREGRPFAGPAGRLLDRALAEAGLDRDQAYVSNAVKHFKFHREGKRRIHEKPDAGQIAACRPWLRAELAVVRPRVLVVLGATAAASILGPSFRVTKQHGQPLEWADYAATSPLTTPDGPPIDDAVVVATVHPSAVLRSRERDAAYAGFVADLRAVADVLS
ncbi:UdgX family uracil-DNA binding protein [Jiangella rhizosphaerae]|uniref:Type-4 uracil-DNA glycosylase n=1 Tax=Jiangella rhizosphaerae TaxID=2293569 RepID=A0A418KXF3_9ACTN|nr:UdgX family uracil-DNA binding protein [Jiangella rhizosphaerae]RIQ37431.1 uracil-DNA glycosylase [Jiangella rhizosphaerae]